MKRYLKIVLVAICAFSMLPVGIYIFKNKIISAIIEKTGEKAFGAKVEVDNLDFNIFKMSIKTDSFQVADAKNTWFNLIETGECEFDVHFKPLLNKKIIIETLSVKNIQSGTKRKTDGKLLKMKKGKKSSVSDEWVEKYAAEKLEQEKKKIPVLNPAFLKDKIDVDTLISEMEFITPVKVKEIEAYLDTRENFWKDKITERNYEKRVGEIGKGFKTIEGCNFDTISKAESCLSTIKKLKSQIKLIKDDISEDKKIVKNDIAILKNYKNEFPDWVSQDKARAEKLIQLDGSGIGNIALMLFGERVSGIMATSLGYIANLRKLKQNEATKKTTAGTSPKQKTDKSSHLPDLWIKKAMVSGVSTHGVILSGKIHDLTENQTKTGKPVEFNLEGKSSPFGDVVIGGIIDYRGINENETITLSFNNIPVKNYKLSGSEFFPTTIAEGKGRINASLICSDKNISADLFLAIDDVVFDAMQPAKESRVTKILTKAISGINHINVLSTALINENETQIKIKSNLDKIVADGLRNILQTEMAVAKERLNTKVDSILTVEKNNFDSKINKQEKATQTQFHGINDTVINIENKVDDKKNEIETKIKNKINKKTKKLFKKLKI